MFITKKLFKEHLHESEDRLQNRIRNVEYFTEDKEKVLNGKIDDCNIMRSELDRIILDSLECIDKQLQDLNCNIYSYVADLNRENDVLNEKLEKANDFIYSLASSDVSSHDKQLDILEYIKEQSDMDKHMTRLKCNVDKSLEASYKVSIQKQDNLERHIENYKDALIRGINKVYRIPEHNIPNWSPLKPGSVCRDCTED